VRRVTLVLGGARSGKSRFAEELALRAPPPRSYIATAEAFDQEMAERIARHRSERAGKGWTTHEAPLHLAAALQSISGLALVDCITVWLGNLMHHQQEIATAVESLCAVLAARQDPVILVSNEVGLSIVPENAMARRFRDEQGLLNQRLAAAADEVYVVIAGLAMKLKG
jgi:adenosylcobinamide kinase/adenosylcobinamide-phosphate guanylyltransferase